MSWIKKVGVYLSEKRSILLALFALFFVAVIFLAVATDIKAKTEPPAPNAIQTQLASIINGFKKIFSFQWLSAGLNSLNLTYMANSTTTPAPPAGSCTDGQKRCLDSNTLQTCKDGQWGQNFGCAILHGTGVCSGGQCTVTCTDLGCMNGRQCNQGSCDYYGNCSYSGGSCEDSNPCTTNDSCSVGNCTGTAVADGTSCTPSGGGAGACKSGQCVAKPSPSPTSTNKCCVCAYQEVPACADIQTQSGCVNYKTSAGINDCAWTELGGGNCESRFQKFCSDRLSTDKTCDVRRSITRTKNTDADIIDILNNNSCKSLSVSIEAHGDSDGCNTYRNTIEACMMCSPRSCSKYNFYYPGCSVFQNRSQVDNLAQSVQFLLNSLADTEVVTITANQVVGCENQTSETITITGQGINKNYGSCSLIENQKCWGHEFSSAQKQTTICTDSSGNNKTLMCCPATGILTWLDPSWAWTTVSSQNPQCPGDTPKPQGNPNAATNFSLYVVRDAYNFIADGIAYVITPHITLNKNAVVTINYGDYSDVFEPNTYITEDQESILKSCQSTVLDSVTKNIGSGGDTISLDNEMTINIPAGAVANATNFGITKYNLANCSIPAPSTTISASPSITPSPSPTPSPVTTLNQYDTFNSAIDTTRWAQLNASNPAIIENGKLKAVGKAGTSAVSSSGLTSQGKQVLHGDFDIQVDFDSTIQPASDSGATTALNVVGTKSYSVFNSKSNTGTYWTSAWTTQGNTLWSVGSPAGLGSGKYRLQRTGSTMTGYQWQNSNWVKIASLTNCDTSDMYVQLTIANNIGAGNFHPKVPQAYFDNFMVNDTFNSAIDTTRWAQLNASNPAIIENGKLKAVGKAGTSAVSSSGLTSQGKQVLHGDFDIQVDFDSTIQPASDSGATTALNVVGTKSYSVFNSKSNTGTYWTSAWTTQGNTLWSVGSPAGLGSGKYRLQRTGSTMTGYQWQNSNWVKIASLTNCDTSDMYVQLTIANNIGAGNFHPKVPQAYFDNFMVNSASVANPAIVLNSAPNSLALVSASATASAALGSKIQIQCNYGAVLPCTGATHGGDNCTFLQFSGTTANFECTTKKAGMQDNYCVTWPYAPNPKCTGSSTTKIQSTMVNNKVGFLQGLTDALKAAVGFLR